MPPLESNDDCVVGVKVSPKGLPRLFNIVQELGGDVAEPQDVTDGGGGGIVFKGRFTLAFNRLLDDVPVEFGSMVKIGTSS